MPTHYTTCPTVRLEFEHFSTAAVVPERRHEAWAARGFPSISALYSSVPLGPFDTTTDFVRLDGLILQYATGTPRQIERDATRIAADGVMMLGLGTQHDGVLIGDADGVPFRCEPNDVVVLDMGRPSRLTLPAGRSIQLAIPRLRALAEFGTADTLHGLVLPAARASLLLDYLERLRAQLPQIAADQQSRVARTIVDLIALASDGARALPASGDGAGSEPRASAARRAIELALSSSALDVAYLCRELGVSRSALYQEFRGDGGVLAYIRARRLERVRAALLDPDDRTRIAELGHRWGFGGESHLSRQFRAAYGIPPQKYRMAAVAGQR